ncbi:Hint domain-containing protein [Pseudosulfitobacter koreensis]|uniref:Hint domain-containing protein n=1 Tax=Pseudosulfitobacter koreensis TaxID=2968472 RepID=A0ABT1YZ69_9RHOB|nr:Hint domain-containing protein [Pseudosulfitobacter koreense]MCR8826164.1 Hint domain-containing protein [Pseudosulfitobacter koreense]
MTISAAPSGHSRHQTYAAPISRSVSLPASRTYEIAALRADGSRLVSQVKAPALPLIEQAFSAFARGTVLEGRDGPIAIEDLQPGDWLRTGDGEAAQAVWIGSTSFVPADTGRRTPLIRIMADTFGPGRPESFLTVGPSARLLQTPHHLRGNQVSGAQMLTLARDFVDGVNVIEVAPPTQVRLFHLCLTRHATVFAGGLQMETFHPGTQSTRSVSHAVRDLFLGMFPRISHVTDFGALAHLRAPDGTEEAA